MGNEVRCEERERWRWVLRAISEVPPNEEGDSEVTNTWKSPGRRPNRCKGPEMETHSRHHVRAGGRSSEMRKRESHRDEVRGQLGPRPC